MCVCVCMSVCKKRAMNPLNFRGLFLCETTSMKMFHNAKFKAGQKKDAGKKGGRKGKRKGDREGGA